MFFLWRRLKFFVFFLATISPLAFPFALDASSISAETATIFQPGRHRIIREGLSTNWSGYASLTSLTNPTLNSVSDVKADWTVPTLTCGANTTYSSAWVGIDGYSDSTVEQLGTEHDCYRGQSYFSAWYEIYPRAMHTFNIAIHAGDQISAEVRYIVSNRYRLTLLNQTTGKTVSTTQSVRAQRTSAEWVVEAPSSYFGVLPLSNFGQITFTNAVATINSHVGAINDPLWQTDPITMVTPSLLPKAVPSSLDSTGTSFSVSWQHN